MRIKNINGLSADDLQEEVNKGGRFAYFQFTISFIVVTLKRTSGVYLIRKEEGAALKALPFTVLSLLFGWWGIPYGPKYTVESVRNNLSGGKDVTDEVMATVAGFVLFREAEQRKRSIS
ncbi:MAG TPA: hypothetical protein VF476_05315 [Chitinophagaceae bacterium]